jgi:hypothetical protein
MLTSHLHPVQNLKVTISVLDFITCTGTLLIYKQDNIKMNLGSILIGNNV